MHRMLDAGRGFCRLDSSAQADRSGTLQVTVPGLYHNPGVSRQGFLGLLPMWRRGLSLGTIYIYIYIKSPEEFS